MKKSLASFLAAPVFLFVAAGPAQAQTRTWVSGVGDDLNPCSRTAPCKTFAGAISKTAGGGEINCLDPGGFGAVTIAKSITIDCGPYTMGSILAANTNGVIVNAAGIVVQLRGLRINGANTATGNGVRILNAAAVNIDDVVIENFGGAGPSNGRGVSIETAVANVRVTIQNSRLYNNNFIGIHSNPSTGNVILNIVNTSIARGGNSAVQLRALTAATVHDSAIMSNNGVGVMSELSTVTTLISNSLIANNTIGVQGGNSGGVPITRLYGNVITGNTVQGLLVTTGPVNTFGNNGIRGNVGNELPTLPSEGTQ